MKRQSKRHSAYLNRKEVRIDNAKQLEKGISDIVGVFTDPILVFPGGWGDTLPDWLKEAITLERLVMNMRALKGEEMTGTDAEACAYLYDGYLTTAHGQRLDTNLPLHRRQDILAP